MQDGKKRSNPYCRKETKGPHSNEAKRVSIGQAAHITAASPGGARYDSNLTPEQRSSIKNAIWLCNDCAKMIDNDEEQYPVELLYTWKNYAEYEQWCIINQRQNLVALNMQPEPRKKIGCRKIKERLEDLHSILKYAYIYYKQNFNGCYDACLENAIMEHFHLYEEELKKINVFNEKQNNLLRDKIEYALDIGQELYDMIDEYSETLNFVYQTDGWGGYDNYWSSFFSMVVNKIDFLERQKTDIDRAMQHIYATTELYY